MSVLSFFGRMDVFIN